MNTKVKTFTLGLLLAALIPFSPAAYAADPEKSDVAATPTPALHEGGASQAPAAAVAPAGRAEPAPAAAPAQTVAPETPLHEVGASGSAAAAAPTDEPREMHRHHHGGDNADDRVSVGGETYVGPSETVEGNAVAVFGPDTVDGNVNGNAVAVMGTNKVNGTVHGNSVAVMGTNTITGTVHENAVAVMGTIAIDGTVHGDTVAVLGDMNLGPKARLDGDAVCVGGRINKDPSAVIGGAVVQQMGGLGSWWKHGLSKGRPFAIGPSLHLLWIANLCIVAFYAILALLFPGGIRKCADTIEHRPGIVFLTGILSVLAMPVLFILLLVTVVGIPVALVVLPLSVLVCTLFGKAALYAFVGRSIVGKQVHPALALLVGVAIFIALGFIPILGLMIWCLVSFVGFACALTTLFASTKPAPPAGTPPAAAAQLAAVPAAVVASAPGAVPPPAQSPIAESVPPAASPSVPPVVSAAAPPVPAPVPPISEAGYAKAGFWIRMAALLIDVILVGIIFHHMSVLFMPAIAAYGAVLWKFKGATIGGIVFGLKVVRSDGRPMEWVTAVVRALACYLSLVCIGLGFLWIAFDPEKRGWHDKIAGTVVVRLPKGLSLV